MSAKAFCFLKEAVHTFLRGLDLASLRLLAKIVSRENSEVCLNIDELNTTQSSIQTQRYLISRVWRWPDLKDGSVLKHIEESSGEEDEAGMGDCLCVNPFHFSRISKRGKCNVFIMSRALCLLHAPPETKKARAMLK